MTLDSLTKSPYSQTSSVNKKIMKIDKHDSNLIPQND